MSITRSVNSPAIASISARSRGSFWFSIGLQCRLQSPAWPKIAACTLYLCRRARILLTNSAICSGWIAASSMKRVLRRVPSRRDRIGEAALRTAQMRAVSSGRAEYRTSFARPIRPVRTAASRAILSSTSFGSSPSSSTIRIASVPSGSVAPVLGSASRITCTKVASRSSTADGPNFRISTTAAPDFSRSSNSARAVAFAFGTGTMRSVASRIRASVPSDPTRTCARSMLPFTASRRA